MNARAVAGLALLAIAALLPLFPPFDQPWGRPDSTLERLYPGVPAWWLAARLASLVGAALLLGFSREKDTPAAMASRPGIADGGPNSIERIPRAAAGLALLLALAHLGLALTAATLPRSLQAAYALLFVAPTAVLALAGATKTPMPSLRRAMPLASLLGAWVLVTQMLAPSLRPASAVDLWFCWDCLASASREGSNLLTEGPLPGLSAFHFVLQGVGLMRFDDLASTWPLVRGIQIAWMIVAALAVAHGTSVFRLGSPLVAAAALLFSPFAFLAVTMPCPIFLGDLLGGLALAALATLWVRPSAAALTALGATAGLAATHPSLVPLAAACLVAAAARLRATPRLPASAVFTALAGLLAAAIPAIPSPTTVAQMADRYASGSTSYTVIQGVLLGQFSPVALRQASEALGHRFEIFSAAIVTPWLTSPTPIRLWSDSLFDPLGAALAAVGLAVALRQSRTSVGPRLVLLLLVAALAPGVVSNFDRPSATRMMALGVPIALLAAIGAARVALVLRSFGRHESAALATCGSPVPIARGLSASIARGLSASFARGLSAAIAALIVVGGTSLFVRVVPSVVPASSLEILLEALRSTEGTRLAMLDYVLRSGPDTPEELDWFYFEETLAALAPERGRVVPFRGEDDLADVRLGDSELAGWSRAAEKDGAIGDAVCRRWRDATVWTLTDRSGFSIAQLATPAGFQPPPSRPWDSASQRPCDEVQAAK